MTRPLQTITEIMWPLGTKKSNEKQEVGKVNVGLKKKKIKNE